MENAVYRSKVDKWLVGLVLAIFSLCLYLSWQSEQASPPEVRITSLITIFAVLGLVSWSIVFTTWPCQYTLEKNGLSIRCGKVISKFIPYSRINNCYKTSSFLSAPALSLSRINIQYKGGEIMISPVEREVFIAELERRIKASGSVA